MMSTDADSSPKTQSILMDCGGKVPVEHLDYGFIEKCTDVKYVEKILEVLRSGDEGIYPHLIQFCETHLEKLDPRSEAIKKDIPVATEATLNDQEWSQIIHDLKTLQEETKNTDSLQKQQSLFDEQLYDHLPPVRGSNLVIPLTKKSVSKEKRTLSKCPVPRDYREWDKFDVDEECEKVDDCLNEKDPPATSNTGFQKIKDEVETSALFRRAIVHKHMGDLSRAAEDLKMVIRKEEQNHAASKLLSEIEEKMRESKPEQTSRGKKILIQEVDDKDDVTDDEEDPQHGAHPVQHSQPVGGDESSAAPVERRDMGNAQKKPHSRGDGGPHCESNDSHHGGNWRSKGSSSDKYRVSQANGSSKRGSTASAQSDQCSSSSSGKGTAVGGNTTGSVNLDAPCGALPPQLCRLKNEGNLLFKNGQFGDALDKYSQAIQGYSDSGIDSPEDLCVLYSNRAACYLKDGNSHDCIQDCTRALELQPFSLKPLLRRAMAYESLERYRKAYIDYKTVLQIDTSVKAAHDSCNRITRVLIEQDGSEWREKLPEIPVVPLSAQQHRREEPPSAEVLHARAEKAARDAERRAEVRFTALKQEGNDFVKKGQYQEALGKYTECLKLKPEECPIYTNRALCYLKLQMFAEAKHDCDEALKQEPTNKKAFYRRALANKGLKDYLACSSDLQEVLQLDPNVQEAEKELEEVTLLVRQSLSNNSPAKPRKSVPITEVDDDTDTVVGNSENDSRGDNITVNLRPNNAYDFGQYLNATRHSGNMSACAKLLASTAPDKLPELLSTQLDGHTISFIMQTMDSHLVEKDPNLVYQHLKHLHTTDRFSVALMLVEKDERQRMTQLFERLAAVESSEFTKNDVQNLANRYI
ncbi:sperm-associated antigen 1 isoform X2 [Gouania willdenowi]|uniref:sperm-associated antigen 1 isoform X2 n=1 Tax=Gouania willdenowi TaxID=441366 RepID=UPI001055A82F|nr:sperm-associated antigen 1 isoform X2 [Gouania willdenowi]